MHPKLGFEQGAFRRVAPEFGCSVPGMTTNPTESGLGDPDAQVVQSIRVLMAYAGIRTAKELGIALGLPQQTMSRRMNLQQGWTFAEVARVAAYFGVTLDEMQNGLPTLSEWTARDLRGCRDSNPRPSDLSSTRQYVKAALTGNRAPRHLWAVAS